MPKKNRNASYIRLPKQKRSQEKYDSVVEAMGELLLHKKYEKITMMDISLCCGVPTATIYQYFADKESIGRVWYSTLIEQYIESQKGISSATSQSLCERESLVRTMIVRSLNFVICHRKSLENLFKGVPEIVTSELLKILEERIIVCAKEFDLGGIGSSGCMVTSKNVRVLVRLITGYYLQIILNSSSDIENEAEEVAALAVFYLKESQAQAADF